MKDLRKIYTSFFSKWAIAIVIFTLSRFLFYLFNYSYFTSFNFSILWGGLRFDWMTTSILYLPFLIAHLIDFKGNSKILRILFHLSNSLAIIFNCIDFEYYKFTYKRTTADLFLTSGIEKDILNLIPAFLKDYWYIVLIIITLIWFSNWLYSKSLQQKTIWPGLKIYLLFVIPSFAFIAIGFRGGLQYRPLNVIQAGKYANAKNIPLVLNTPFTILKSATKNELKSFYFFPKEDLNSIYQPIVNIQSDSTFRPLNVVLIIAESFSSEYIGAFNPGKKSYTPYLDTLISQSLMIKNSFANGKKSIEALPAILSSIPTLMNTAYISSKYGSNQIESIGSKLKEKGYRTVFYHGGENGTMGFNAFTKIAGIDEYIGRSQYPNQADYDGHWGIFDEPFLQFVTQDLSQGKQPFFAGIFTLSSHHPFTVPEPYIKRFSGGPLPILKSIQYADFALNRFFEAAKKEAWFHNTLFVITADHTSQGFRESYNNRMGMYSIPIIFYSPAFLAPQQIDKVSQQNDIFPSILDFLNYKGKIFSFGQSIFSPEEGFSVDYINQIYQLIEGDYCLQFDGEQAVAFYHWKVDPQLKTNLINAAKYSEKKATLENKLKAILQQYTEHMKLNQLMVK